LTGALLAVMYDWFSKLSGSMLTWGQNVKHSETDPFPMNNRGPMKKLVSVVLLCAGLLPFLFAGFFLISLLSSLFIEVRFDLMVDNHGLIPGSLAGALLLGLFVLCFFLKVSGPKKFLPGLLSALALLATIGWSAFNSTIPDFEIYGSSPASILEVLDSGTEPPEYMVSLGMETRLCKALTRGRDLLAPHERVSSRGMVFGAGVTGVEDGRVSVEVYSGGERDAMLFSTPYLKASSWQDFEIPFERLPPFGKQLYFRVKMKSESSREKPLVFISRPRSLAGGRGPNIVLICIDTLRADYLDCAPFLQALKRKSTVFEHALAPCSFTIPSVASLLTGLLPHEHGFLSNASLGYKEGATTLPQQAGANGYLSVAFSANSLICPRNGYFKGFDRFHSIGEFQESYLNSGRILTLKAAKWLRSNQSAPFFLYMHYMDPHYPYLAPPPHTFGDEDGLSFALFSLHSFFRYDMRYMSKKWAINHPGQMNKISQRYKGEISYVDQQIKDLFEILQEQDILRNTIVVVTSDHGESFGEHGNHRHGNSLYQEEIHVPLIIFDGRAPAAARSQAPVSIYEVPRIIAGLAGFEPAPSWKGRRLDQILAGTSRTIEAELVTLILFMEKNKETLPDVRTAAVDGKEKLIRHYHADSKTVSIEFYDLSADPGENNNLWPAKRGRELLDFINRTLPPPEALSTKPPQPLTLKHRQQLKALGYLD